MSDLNLTLLDNPYSNKAPSNYDNFPHSAIVQEILRNHAIEQADIYATVKTLQNASPRVRSTLLKRIATSSSSGANTYFGVNTDDLNNQYINTILSTLDTNYWNILFKAARLTNIPPFNDPAEVKPYTTLLVDDRNIAFNQENIQILFGLIEKRFNQSRMEDEILKVVNQLTVDTKANGKLVITAPLHSFNYARLSTSSTFMNWAITLIKLLNDEWVDLLDQTNPTHESAEIIFGLHLANKKIKKVPSMQLSLSSAAADIFKPMLERALNIKDIA